MISKKYCVIGNPIGHSRSPWIHQRFAQLTGQNLTYEARLAPLDGFAASARAFFSDEGGYGCNVTVPFKYEAAAFADTRSQRVALCGASNTLIRQEDGSIHAENTDGLGLVADIQNNAGRSLAGQDILLLGAGGAAAGVLAPLLEQRPRSICVSNRTVSRAQDLVESHGALAESCEVHLHACGLSLESESMNLLGSGFDVLINATASSLQGQALNLPSEVVRSGALAYDMMYGSAAQGFLDWAQACNSNVQVRSGLGMLVEQAAAAFEMWRGVRPPSAEVLQELLNRLR